MADILLLGVGLTTLSALESLVSTCKVQGIVRKVDSETYQGDPVVNLAQQLDIPVFSDISKTQIKSLILKLQPDCVVVSSYNQILPLELIELSPFINVHYSPLPLYRGRANVNWAIINNESYAAISIHQISEQLDQGNILFQQLIPIHAQDTIADIYQKLNELQSQNLGPTVIKFLNGDLGIPQNSQEATYCCTRLPEDGEIDWSNSTQKIDCLIRALTFPFPGAYTYYQGKKMIIWKAENLNNSRIYVGKICGRVVNISKENGYVDILTGDGILRIFEVQIEGSKKKEAALVIKSVKTTLGLKISDLLNRIQNLEKTITKLKSNEK